MKLGPCLDEPLLFPREGSRNYLNWVDPEHSYPVLEVRKVQMLRPTGRHSPNRHADTAPPTAFCSLKVRRIYGGSDLA